MADGTLIKDLTQTTSINDDDDMIIEDSTPTTKRVAVSDLGLKIAPTTNKIWYATCTTTSGTTAKVATTQKDGFELTTGAMIAVRFTYNNTVNNPTLNVNSTGAKAIVTGGTSSGGSTNAIAYHWPYSDIILFCYNGSYWMMIGKMVATTTYYGVTKLTDSTSSTSTTTAATPNSVKTAYDAAVAAQETADELNSNLNGLTAKTVATTSSGSSYTVTPSASGFAFYLILNRNYCVGVYFGIGNASNYGMQTLSGTAPSISASSTGFTITENTSATTTTILSLKDFSVAEN